MSEINSKPSPVSLSAIEASQSNPDLDPVRDATLFSDSTWIDRNYFALTSPEDREDSYEIRKLLAERWQQDDQQLSLWLNHHANGISHPEAIVTHPQDSLSLLSEADPQAKQIRQQALEDCYFNRSQIEQQVLEYLSPSIWSYTAVNQTAIKSISPEALSALIHLTADNSTRCEAMIQVINQLDQSMPLARNAASSQLTDADRTAAFSQAVQHHAQALEFAKILTHIDTQNLKDIYPIAQEYMAGATYDGQLLFERTLDVYEICQNLASQYHDPILQAWFATIFQRSLDVLKVAGSLYDRNRHDRTLPDVDASSLTTPQILKAQRDFCFNLGYLNLLLDKNLSTPSKIIRYCSQNGISQPQLTAVWPKPKAGSILCTIKTHTATPLPEGDFIGKHEDDNFDPDQSEHKHAGTYTFIAKVKGNSPRILSAYEPAHPFAQKLHQSFIMHQSPGDPESDIRINTDCRLSLDKDLDFRQIHADTGRTFANSSEFLRDADVLGQVMDIAGSAHSTELFNPEMYQQYDTACREIVEQVAQRCQLLDTLSNI